MNNTGRKPVKRVQKRRSRARQRRLKGLGFGVLFLALLIAVPVLINEMLCHMGHEMVVSATESTSAPTVQPTEAVWVYQSPAPDAQITPTAEPAASAQPEGEQTPEAARGANADRVIDPNKKMVALTFDDGPYTPVTERIIKTLEKYDGRGTFFVVGNRVDDYSEILKRTYEGGHQIGTHTWSHKNLKKSSAETVKTQVTKSMDAIKAVTGENPTLLRPPYGAVNKTVKQRVKDAGNLALVNWSVDSLDWKSKNAGKIVKAIMKDVKDGDIVLMHDLYESTAEAVEKLVPRLVEEGYQLVTVEELYAARGDALEPGTLHFKNPPGDD